MTVVIAALAGFFSGRLLWLAMRASWSRQELLRKDGEGNLLPTAVGAVLALSLLLVEAIRMAFSSGGDAAHAIVSQARTAGLVAVVGAALVGVVDDLVGPPARRGLMAHLKALGRGELAPAGIRTFALLLVGATAAGLLGPRSMTAFLVDAAVIVLAANLVTLFDGRPGRSIKAGVVLFLVAALAGGFSTSLVAAAVVAGAATSLALDDLHGRVLIGRTGTYALGAAVGVGIASHGGPQHHVAAALVLLGCNLLSEAVPFTKLVDALPPLRWLDSLGRRRPALVDLREFRTARAGRSAPAEVDLRDGIDAEDDVVPLAPLRPDFPFRRTTDPSGRGTVGGAHESSDVRSPVDDQQDPFGGGAFGSPREGGEPTAPTAPTTQQRLADPPTTLFGFERRSVHPHDGDDDPSERPEGFDR